MLLLNTHLIHKKVNTEDQELKIISQTEYCEVLKNIPAFFYFTTNTA